ncbi:MAG: hybrid sensor histidine kinase/response regulator, partial [Planctomycetota bacterium]
MSISTVATKTIPRIITIDDNPSIHEDFQKILSKTGEDEQLSASVAAFFGESESSENVNPLALEVELDSALQGEDGYQKVLQAVSEGRPYTLAFCDMRMPPGWDGLTTIEKLWEADPNLQVVICSAYSDSTWLDISQRLGHSDRLLILKKPFDNVEVLQLAVALIEKRRLIDESSRRQEHLENLVRERTIHLNEARRESERILNSIDSLMIQLDCDQVVQRWNHAAGRIFNVSMEEAVGVGFLELDIQWDGFETVQSLVCSENQESSARVQVVFMDKDYKARVVG